MKVSKIWFIGLASLAVVGCNNSKGDSKSGYKPVEVERLKAGEYKPGEEAQLFPFAVGNQWTYDVEISFQAPNAPTRQPVKRLLRFRCTQVVKTAKGQRMNMEVVMDGKVNEVQEWILNNDGLFQSSVGYPPKPFKPMQAAWRSPLKQGAKFAWTGIGYRPDGTVGPAETTSEVLQAQEVDTEAGQVMSIPVKTLQKWGKGNVASSTTWWASGYGIVRYRQEAVTPQGITVQVMRLKSVSIDRQAK